MRRRDFLKATVALAGAALFIPACGDDAGDDEETLLDGAALFTLGVASGDPRADSVILWTRIGLEGDADAALALQVARDEAFTDRVSFDGGAELSVAALARFDRCAKVRVTGLDAATTYYYRFVYRADGTAYVSGTGRTRTAPAADADVAVRFAFVSCQDITGRYFNSYKRMLAEELDFFVHLGDYVYETTGDPSFQTTTPGRGVTFTDVDGAVAITEDGETFYSASSLSNYRELYKTYRADRTLQQVHARYPMIAIWDDHEFSDDCHGVTTTMYGGRVDEADPGRRARANQAWFEYMPVDFDDDTFTYDAAASPPTGLRIYRDFRFGAHVHLVMTDLRLFRPDHIVAEDAFPGRVAIEEAALTAQEGALPEWAEPYVDVDTFADGAYAAALGAAAPLLGYDAVHATGLVAVRYVNRAVAALADDGQTDWDPIVDTTGLARGLAYVTLGKASPYSSIGSRYLAIRDPFQAFARFTNAASGAASEDLLGPAQREWFLQTMRGSTATWKVWGNEFCLTSRVVDTRAFSVPDDFRQLFLLSVEDWDGAPNQRDTLLTELSALDNVVAITGDIHAFFASTPWAGNDPSKRIVEFVGSAISSGTYQRLLVNTAASDPSLAAAGASALALLVEDMLTDAEAATNPHMGYASINENGFVVAEVSADAFNVTYHATAAESARTDLADDAVAAAFTATRFRVLAGEATLYRVTEGGDVERWDHETLAWRA